MIINNFPEWRVNNINLLDRCLGEYNEYCSRPICVRQTLTCGIERKLHEKYGDNYGVFLITLLRNIDATSPLCVPAFVKRIINGEISPVSIVVYDYRNNNPEQFKHIYKRINDRKKSKVVVQKTSNLYRCKNCSKNDMYIEIKQTRALDEASTMFGTCKHCSRRAVVG